MAPVTLVHILAVFIMVALIMVALIPDTEKGRM